MSETDAMADLEASIEALESDESKDESDVESDAASEEVTETEEVEEAESDAGKEEETSDEASDDSQDDSETASEVEFDFHNTPTSIQKLVSNLKDLPESERTERISKLTREKEIEAVKQAFPDALKEEAPVKQDDLAALTKKIEQLEKLANPEALQKALEIAAKLNATESLTDGRMKDLMLQEQFGDDYKEVSKDPKFINAFEKYPALTMEERLEIACSLSPIARQLATDTEVKKQVRLKSTKTVSKGKQTTETKGLTPEGVDNLDKFEALIEERLGG